MPIYEYACRDCGERFEKLVRRFGEAVACPSCDGTSVDKQLSVFAVASASSHRPATACEAGPCGMGRCDGGPCGGGGCGFPSGS